MKKILLPTDFSQDAEKAYILAAELARKHNAEIFLTHLAISWTGMLTMYNIYDEQEIIDSTEKGFIERAVKKMKDLSSSEVFKGVNVNGEVKLMNTTNSVQEFLDYANSNDFDLIVLGTSGHDDQIESFAEKITRSSNAPVISCYKNIDAFNPSHVLIATDFETVNAGFFNRLNKVMGTKSYQKTLLFVNTKKNFATDAEINHDFKTLVNKYHLENAQLKTVNAANIDEAILAESKEKTYDLLAVTTHGRTGFSRLFFKSHAGELVNKSDTPVFTYNLHDFLENVADNVGGFHSGFTG